MQITTEALQAIKRQLLQLPLNEREVVSLCCEQGFSLRVAAEILTVPPQTLADRLKRGLQKLRRNLVQHGFGMLKLAKLSEALLQACSTHRWSVIRPHPLAAADWESELGGWELRDGEWVSQEQENVLVWKLDAPGSFRFLAEGWSEAGLELSLIGHRPSREFRNYSIHSGYYFEFGAEFNFCTKLARGLFDVMAKPAIRVEPRRRYTLMFEYDDDHGLIHCAVDGKRVFSYRERAPFPGNRVGFYAWGASVHWRVIELQLRNWGPDVPNLRAADRLYQYGRYAEALECYRDIAARSSDESVFLDARLKMGMCQALVQQLAEATKCFRSLAGTALEPHALAEEALLHLRNETTDDAPRGIALFAQLSEKFPGHPANVQTQEAAERYCHETILHGSTRTQDLAIRAELEHMGAVCITPPAGSQVCCAARQIPYLFRSGAWGLALKRLTTFAARMHPAQRDGSGFQSSVLAAALANGREDLLPEDVFALHDWLPPIRMDWCSGVIAHCVIRKGQQDDFLRAYAAGRAPAYGSEEHKLLSVAQIAFSHGDVQYATKLLDVSIKDFHTQYWVGGVLAEARQGALFEQWAAAMEKKHNNRPNWLRTLAYLRGRWAVEGGDLAAAATPLNRMAPPPLGFYFSDGFVLQVMLASLGLLRAPSAETLAAAVPQLLSGTLLELCEVFLGRRSPDQIHCWPDGLWRPEWRLWLALWLEAKGDKKDAQRAIQPACDPRYGPTHSQPAIALLLQRISDKTCLLRP